MRNNEKPKSQAPKHSKRKRKPAPLKSVTDQFINRENLHYPDVAFYDFVQAASNLNIEGKDHVLNKKWDEMWHNMLFSYLWQTTYDDKTRDEFYCYFVSVQELCNLAMAARNDISIISWDGSVMVDLG